jgi:hypothetical protein
MGFDSRLCLFVIFIFKKSDDGKKLASRARVVVLKVLRVLRVLGRRKPLLEAGLRR